MSDSVIFNILMATAVIFALFAEPVQAVEGIVQGVEVPYEIQWALISKILIYEKNLNSRCDDSIVIGILFQKGDLQSEKAKDDMLSIFQLAELETILNLPVKVFSISIDHFIDPTFDFGSIKVNHIYITDMRGVELSPVFSVCSTFKMLSITGTESLFSKGASVGLVLNDNKPSILINSTSAKNEGVEFGYQLLKHAKVYN